MLNKHLKNINRTSQYNVDRTHFLRMDANERIKPFGKKLMKKAEEIALENDFEKIVVISGIGVKNYYKKLGYHKEGTFMVKRLKTFKHYILDVIYFILCVIVGILIALNMKD